VFKKLIASAQAADSRTGCPRNLSPRGPSNERADRQDRPTEIVQTADAAPSAAVEPQDLRRCSTTLMEAGVGQVVAVESHDGRIQALRVHDVFAGAWRSERGQNLGGWRVTGEWASALGSRR
jgi:hypothetical protein